MDRILSGVLGFAIGDAVGVPVEFTDRTKLLSNPVQEMLGFGSYDVPAGSWSDDTSMTLATMDSVSKTGKINCNDMAMLFCNWINNADYTANGFVFDIGITTKYALLKFMKDKCNASLCGGTGFNENGNGSLMRMLPIAFYCYYHKSDDNDIYEIVKKVSSITHAHEISIMSCYVYVKYVINILNGQDKLQSYKNIKNFDYANYFQDDTIKAYDRILKDNINELKVSEIDSNGYVVSTLETVLWTVINSNSYTQSIIVAVNLGNDTDTNAAITGSVTGIIYGMETFPNEWLSKLERVDYIKDISEKFSSSLLKS